MREKQEGRKRVRDDVRGRERRKVRSEGVMRRAGGRQRGMEVTE